MIYNTVPLGGVIRKVMRDLKPSGDNWVSDAIEWAGEALESIGSGPGYETHVELIKVANYTAKMPAFLMELNAVKCNPLDVTSSDMRSYNVLMQYEGSVFPRAIHCEGCSNELAISDYRYVIRGNAFKVNFETGYICVSYKRFAVDEKGWPLVPDDISFKQAIYWYIFLKMMEGGMVHQHISYMKAEERWLHYAGQARDESKLPDIPQAENFMNQWVRLIPNMTGYETGFDDIAKGEQLDRDYISDKLWGPNDPLADVINDTTEL